MKLGTLMYHDKSSSKEKLHTFLNQNKHPQAIKLVYGVCASNLLISHNETGYTEFTMIRVHQNRNYKFVNNNSLRQKKTLKWC